MSSNLINSKSDLKYYLNEDKKALKINKRFPSLFSDEIWRFQIRLRKCEFAENCLKSKIYTPYRLWRKLLLKQLSVKLGFTIPINVFGPGLSIAHYGNIVINQEAKIGKNCRIQEGVNIGSTGGSSIAPIIGDNVFIGTGAKIIGDIKIANNIAVGAGSVVVKSFEESGVTIAGVPAKKISSNSSACFINWR